MKKRQVRENNQIRSMGRATENAHTSGFIKEAISESRSFVKEIARSKHITISAQPSHSTKGPLYYGI